MRKITIVWTLLLILIVSGLTFIGYRIKDNESSNIMEETLTKECEKYLNLYVSRYPKLGEQVKITSEELIDAGYNPNLDSDCVGYVIVKNTNMGFKFNSYVKCPEYTTSGYEK